MAANIVIANVKAFALDAFIPTTADAARIVLETEPNHHLPQVMTIQVTDTGTTLNFPDCKTVMQPKITSRATRSVYLDERWKLRETIMPRSFNGFGPDGQIDAASEKTIEELWDEIALRSGLTIDVGTLPDMKIPAPWAGKTATEAANDLLSKSCCVMVYDHTNSKWMIHQVATGTAPDVAKRLYQPVQIIKPTAIKVYSAPKVYVSRVWCHPLLQDSDWSLRKFGDAPAIDPADYWSGFVSQPEDNREQLWLSAFRIWEPDDAATIFPEALTAEEIMILPSRGLSVGPIADGSLNVGPTATWNPGAGQNGLNAFKANAAWQIGQSRSVVVDGRLIVTEKPVLVTQGTDDLKTDTVPFICAFHRLIDDQPEREMEEREITDGTAAPVNIYADWIPVLETDYPHTNIDSTDALATLSTYADCLQAQYNASAQHLRLPSVINPGHSGHIGAVRLLVQLYPRPIAETSIALNYRPVGGTRL